MVYIKLEEKFYNKYSKINYKVFKIINKYSKLKEEKLENGNVLFLQDLEKYTYNKISKYIRINGVTRFCVSDELLKNEKFIEFLKEKNVEIVNGKWLFKHMCVDIVKYICKMKKESLSYQEISILSNDIDRILKKNIFDLAKEVRIINLITSSENKFKRIEKELYEEYGIILNIGKNYQKSLLKSNIILNMDFNEEEVNKFNINTNACIVNFEERINIKEKGFKGINCDFFEINISNEYLKNWNKFNDINSVIFYESLIYKKTSPENILEQIRQDKINVNFLIGKNGRVLKNEYLKL